jgi:nucleoside-diphosphate-sugar epimerase
VDVDAGGTTVAGAVAAPACVPCQTLITQPEMADLQAKTEFSAPTPVDISAAERDLGYRPGWPVEQGIPDYVAWLRDHDH